MSSFFVRCCLRRHRRNSGSAVTVALRLRTSGTERPTESTVGEASNDVSRAHLMTVWHGLPYGKTHTLLAVT